MTESGSRGSRRDKAPRDNTLIYQGDKITIGPDAGAARLRCPLNRARAPGRGAGRRRERPAIARHQGVRARDPVPLR